MIATSAPPYRISRGDPERRFQIVSWRLTISLSHSHASSCLQALAANSYVCTEYSSVEKGEKSLPAAPAGRKRGRPCGRGKHCAASGLCRLSAEQNLHSVCGITETRRLPHALNETQWRLGWLAAVSAGSWLAACVEILKRVVEVQVFRLSWMFFFLHFPTPSHGTKSRLCFFQLHASKTTAAQERERHI